MSEKEQAEALRMLRHLLDYAKAGKLPPADVVAKAEKFLALPAPESHGQRRG